MKSDNLLKFSDCWIPNEWKGKIKIIEPTGDLKILTSKTYFNQIAFYAQSSQFPWRFVNDITGTAIVNSNDGGGRDYNFGWTSNALSNITVNKQGEEVMIPHSSQQQQKVGLLSSNFVSFLTPLLMSIQDYIGVNFIVRARFDMTTRTPDKETNGHLPHVDFYHPHIACIIYMNDSDGDTIIFNETSDEIKNIDEQKIKYNDLTIKEKISPKQGKIVLFDGRYIHTGCSPVNNTNRILLNSNFTNSYTQPTTDNETGGTRK